MSTDKKIAFITGANRGIGFETAKQLGEKGVHVVIGSRDATKGKEAVTKLAGFGIEAETITFEVTNQKDHQAAFKFFNDKFGRLDILINNAGVFKDSAGPSAGNSVNVTNVSSEIMHETFEANFFAPILLTQVLLPLIKKSPAGRIVNLSSILSSLALHSDPKSPIYNSKAFAYNASKTALNAFTVHLAYELRDTKIKVNSAHPGWVKTDMGGPDAMMEVADGGKTSTQLALLPDNGPTGGLYHMGESLPW
ncbi:MAG: SDR family oxidoreductase [Rhizobacter sp.]|nr:SDR family oxidoreductase [Bacteriovorax sp.]